MRVGVDNRAKEPNRRMSTYSILRSRTSATGARQLYGCGRYRPFIPSFICKQLVEERMTL